MEIRLYDEKIDYTKILLLFKTEKDWICYTGKDVIEKYKESLKRSITYVAYSDNELIGYSRSIEDFGFYIYICDLLVHKEHRGNNLGQKLMDCIVQDYPNYEIFVMSDVDEYYKKLGYKREGTLFQVTKHWIKNITSPN